MSEKGGPENLGIPGTAGVAVPPAGPTSEWGRLRRSKALKLGLAFATLAAIAGSIVVALTYSTGPPSTGRPSVQLLN
jgi:hypothetical protein